MQEMISLESLVSHQEIAQVLRTTWIDVNTDSHDVLLSKLNIDGLKTCEGRSIRHLN
jgi:Mor family transcriptional regulator